MREDDIEKIIGQYRQALKVVFFKVVMNEPEARNTNTQLRKLDRLKFLGIEDADVFRPGVIPVRRTRDEGIMVSGRNEYLHRIQICELLLEKFKSVRGDTFRLKKVSGNEDEIDAVRAGILEDAAECASNSLSFPVTET